MLMQAMLRSSQNQLYPFDNVQLQEMGKMGSCSCKKSGATRLSWGMYSIFRSVVSYLWDSGMTAAGPPRIQLDSSPILHDWPGPAG